MIIKERRSHGEKKETLFRISFKDPLNIDEELFITTDGEYQFKIANIKNDKTEYEKTGIELRVNKKYFNKFKKATDYWLSRDLEKEKLKYGIHNYDWERDPLPYGQFSICSLTIWLLSHDDFEGWKMTSLEKILESKNAIYVSETGLLFPPIVLANSTMKKRRFGSVRRHENGDCEHIF